MKPVFQRIAVHAGLTAFVLAIFGFMFVELASIWLASSPGTRTATGDAITATDETGDIKDRLQARVPLLMAVWGFTFVAIGEITLHLWRSRKPAPVTPPVPQQDDAERLLEEIMAQVEAKTPLPQLSEAAEHGRDSNTPPQPLPHGERGESPAPLPFPSQGRGPGG